MGTTGYALHHVVCQTLVRVAGTPHAETNAVMLPHTVRFMAMRAPDAIERLRKAIGGDVADLAATAGATTLGRARASTRRRSTPVADAAAGRGGAGQHAGRRARPRPPAGVRATPPCSARAIAADTSRDAESRVNVLLRRWSPWPAAGCSSAPAPSERDQGAAVKATVDSYVRAFAKGDGKEACDQLTDAAREAVIGMAGRIGATDCPAAMEQTREIGGDQVRSIARKIRVRKVDVTGGTARVTLRADGPGLRRRARARRQGLEDLQPAQVLSARSRVH